MQQEAAELYSQLAAAHLLVFKGDLSYRKLVADVFTDPTVAKEDVLTFNPTACLLLRTLKSDGIVGLPASVDI